MRRKKTMKRSIYIAILTVALVVTIGAMGTHHQSLMVNAQQKSETTEVKIDNFSFAPGTLTVPVGTTVTWTNRDDIPHTAVSTEGAFKSKVMDTDEKFSYKFTKAGTFPYFCSVHPKMIGKVVVQ
jgi:plastocyanin